jgi:hypothetical protein
VKDQNESVDACTRSRKLVRSKQTDDSQDDEVWEIIISNRDPRNDDSPSPERYNIEPHKQAKEFEIEPKKTNKKAYYSVTNKKAKKYNYKGFEINSSTRQGSQAQNEGMLAVINC